MRLKMSLNIPGIWWLARGVRYTDETKEAIAQAWVNSEVTGLDAKTPDGDAWFADPPTTALLGNFLLQELAGGALDRTNHLFTGDRKTDQTIPAVSVNWTPSDDHLLYASYTEGFKRGGVNALDSQLPGYPGGPACPLDNPPGCNPRNKPGAGLAHDDDKGRAVAGGGKHPSLARRRRGKE